MSGFRKRLLIFLSALPALVLLIVLTGSWRMLLTPAVMAFLKDVMRTLWCGLLFGVGVSVFLFVAFTMFDHAKDSRESWKCVPYLTVSLLLPVVGLWAACRLADQPSSGNGVGLLLGVMLGVLLFERVWPRLSPAWVCNYLTLEERYSEPSDWKPKDGLLPPYWMRACKITYPTVQGTNDTRPHPEWVEQHADDLRFLRDHHADMYWKLEDAIWWIGKADKL